MRSAKPVKDFGRNPQISNHVGVTAKAAKFALDEILPNGPLCLGQAVCPVVGGCSEGSHGLDDVPFGLAERGGALGHDLMVDHGRPGLGTNRADQFEGIL
jgi:hypothetical protein